MQSPTDVRAFIRAFGERWFLLMCGPLSVGLAIIALFVESKYYKTLFWVLAVASFILSSYLLWRSERIKRIKTKRRLGDQVSALRQKLPTPTTGNIRQRHFLSERLNALLREAG